MMRRWFERLGTKYHEVCISFIECLYFCMMWLKFKYINNCVKNKLCWLFYKENVWNGHSSIGYMSLS
jgi:hypothetical protein